MNLDEIILAKADAKWTTACLERLNDFPKLKVLRVEASALGENDVKSIAKLKALEHLKLECPKFSESQIKLIGDMKSLQSFHLAALDFPPKSAKLLRVALPKVNEFYLEHIPAILSAPLVEIAKNDTPLAKLQKARLNAALNGMKSICQDSRIGSAHLGGPASLEMMRHLREAILELDDPGLAEPIVRDYVQLAEIAFNAKDARFRQFGESTKENHLLECVYLDAQIIQLKLKKKLDDKKP
jgi:hypothetical protein